MTHWQEGAIRRRFYRPPFPADNSFLPPASPPHSPRCGVKYWTYYHQAKGESLLIILGDIKNEQTSQVSNVLELPRQPTLQIKANLSGFQVHAVTSSSLPTPSCSTNCSRKEMQINELKHEHSCHSVKTVLLKMHLLQILLHLLQILLHLPFPWVF